MIRENHDFETQLEALQLLLQKEHSLPEHRKYLKAIHKDVIPLLIVFNEFLRGNEGIKNNLVMRDMRLAMLSLMVGKEVTTTYDLSVHQVSTIAHFLRERDEAGNYYTPARATSFLENCKNAVEGKVDAREREDRILKELGF